jgi:microcystin-dependent protein
VDVASAATTDIGVVNSTLIRITGTTTITSFGATYRGPRFVRFGGALQLTHNATTLILPGAANITTAAGDCAIVRPVGSPGAGWVVMHYQRAASLINGAASLGANTFTGAQTLPGNAANALEAVPKQQLDAGVAAVALPPGVIMDYGGETCPAGWLECDGSSVARATYPGLFAAIGTLHGSADANSFNLPNHRGRFKRARANGAATDPDRATRTAANPGGVTGDRVGTLQDDQLKSHAHITGKTTFSNGDGLGPYGSATMPSSHTFHAGQAGVTNVSNLTSTTGGNQTNPINAYVMSIIKT